MHNTQTKLEVLYIRWGANKSLARPTSRRRRTESIVSLERGFFSCAEFKVFSLQMMKGSMSCDARNFNNRVTRAVIRFFLFLQGKSPKEIHAILT